MRKGYGMSTYESQDAIFAYNFYRMIHHARHIYFIADSRSQDGQNGELSRYIYQLQYDHDVPIEHRTMTLDVGIEPHLAFTVEKDDGVMKALDDFLLSSTGRALRQLSPSTLNTFISCPLQFYLSKVSRLKEQDEVEEDMESNVMGSVFHETMQHLYEPYCGREVTKAVLNELLHNDLLIDRQLNRAFTHVFLHVDVGNDDSLIQRPQGRHRLQMRVLKHLVQRTIRHDMLLAPYHYIAGEQQLTADIAISGGRRVSLMGKIDRIDRVLMDDGRGPHWVTRIVDYKTGIASMNVSDVRKDSNK